MDDNFDGCGKFHVAADVIAVCMRIDDRRDRLVCQGFDFLQDRLPPPGILRIDDDHAVGSDEYGRIPAAAPQHIQIVSELVDIDDSGLSLSTACLLIRRNRQG